MPKRDDVPVGRSQAIDRASLCQLWGCSDRMARRYISALRAQPSADGLAILSSAHRPAGYWRSNDPAELAAFVAENSARARSTFVAVRSARQLLDSAPGQESVDLDSLPRLPPTCGPGR